MNVNFLISSERSGSNLITKLLDNHSIYCGPTPIHLFRAFNEKIVTYRNLEDDKNWHALIIDVLAFFRCKIGVWKSSLSVSELFEIKPRNFAEIVRYIYQKEVSFHNKKHVFIKEVKTYHFFQFLLENFTNPKFIWLVRDPRDMALSWSQSPVHRGDIVRGAKIWKEDQQETLKLIQKYKNEILLIKYEDLVMSQLATLNRICNFLEINFESTMVDFYKNKLSEENSIQTDNWKNLNKEIIPYNIKKYQKKLSKKQIQYIEFVCQNEMTALNYELDYSLLAENEFILTESDLLKEERNEKSEFLLISDIEKEKRIKWLEKFQEIQGR